ncbi:MAG: diacylglycerol kinase [Flavobacteriales bacterium]|nr:diacylglycerol kinase [Flavobacteriales bacterium]
MKIQNPKFKNIKDLSAGAVLISAIISFAVGSVIFLPKIYQLYIYIMDS